MISGLRPSIATVTLGRAAAGHDIFHKLEQASKNGFRGIEIFYECLEDIADQLSHGTPDEKRLEAARQVRKACDENNLSVIVLQPFMYYDGLIDRKAHAKMIKKLKLFFQIAHILGTDLMQMPTNFLETGTTGDIDQIVEDMAEAADLGLLEDPPIRNAYEAVAWGNHIDTWQGSWEIVQRVNRPNLGLCLDTFHIAGRVWADPAARSGRNTDADKKLAESLAQLVREVDIKKVFYLQVADGERLERPLDESHPFYKPNQRARMSWSRNARVFPFEEDRGGYLPVMDVARALVHGLGYRGWVSMEVFSAGLAETRPSVPVEFARRAAISYARLEEELGFGQERSRL
jgi:4-hydroxyphenylpyruvate dioxygenase